MAVGCCLGDGATGDADVDAGEHLLGFISGRCHQYSRLKGHADGF
jgi:hypothetical protein